jgi:hypothetical protein
MAMKGSDQESEGDNCVAITTAIKIGSDRS